VKEQIKLPEIKWTLEKVQETDWSQYEDWEVVQAAADHWWERIRAGRIYKPGKLWWGADYCPACRRWNSDCDICTLYQQDMCCGGFWDNANEEISEGKIGKACLELAWYLDRRAKELKEQKRDKFSDFKLGDKVKVKDIPDYTFTIVAKDYKDNSFLLFCPDFKHGHHGIGMSNNREGSPIPGYPKSHLWVMRDWLVEVEK